MQSQVHLKNAFPGEIGNRRIRFGYNLWFASYPCFTPLDLPNDHKSRLAPWRCQQFELTCFLKTHLRDCGKITPCIVEIIPWFPERDRRKNQRLGQSYAQSPNTRLKPIQVTGKNNFEYWVCISGPQQYSLLVFLRYAPTPPPLTLQLFLVFPVIIRLTPILLFLVHDHGELAKFD